MIAAVILGVDMPSFQDDPAQSVANEERLNGFIRFQSTTHRDCRFCLKAFNKFIRSQVWLDNAAGYSQESKLAAELLLAGIDLRTKDYTQVHGPLLYHMHCKHHSLPSQTQFVETGVKDAKHVSSTDRSEQTRTCMSIIRSVTPLGKTEQDANANKIRSIISTTADRINPHIRDRHDDGYKERFATLENTMTKAGHFQQLRLDKKNTSFDAKSVTYKRQNVSQQPKPQLQTPAMTGLIPFGKIFQTKAGHMAGLEVELLHRGELLEDVRKWKISARKDKLRQLETKRLVEEEAVDAKAAEERAKKYFKRLSTAVFQFTN